MEGWVLCAIYVNKTFSSQSQSFIGIEAPESRGDSFISVSGDATSLIFNWWSRIIPLKSVFCFIVAAEKKDHCPLSCVNPVLLSLSLSFSLIVQEWGVVYCHWASTERSAKQGAGEWRRMSERRRKGRREGGCCEIWNCCYTNHMGATDFQFGQISCAIFFKCNKNKLSWALVYVSSPLENNQTL